MSIHSTEISVSACYGELPTLMGEFARQASTLKLAIADIQRLQLVLEELFINTITHGHGGNSDAPIRVGLSRDQQGIHLHFIDNAPQFDLTSYTQDKTPEIGGLGIPLILGMTRSIRYQRSEGFNVTELDF